MKTLLLLSFFFAQAASAAGVIDFPEQVQTYTNTDCEKTQSCDLLKFSLHTHEYQANIDGFKTPNFGTTVYFEYFTNTPKLLEEFAFVNFIHGCQFTSRLEGGKVVREYATQNESFGQYVTYRFLNWIIDSVDPNPMYNNTPVEWGLKDLHAPYRWNRVAGSFDSRTEVEVADEAPRENRLYVSDRPGTAFLSDDGKSAENISLEFKTCIYRTKDIPLSTTPENVDFATPIACLPWSSSYVYDFAKQEFTHPQGISCGD